MGLFLVANFDPSSHAPGRSPTLLAWKHGLGPGSWSDWDWTSSPQLCFETGVRHTPWRAFKLCRYAKYRDSTYQ
ncbi:uncharacterized protein PgNI_04296 [Pyricularia grisea]|uniref:Uncharacterized protein n=1 Tax=Pyricularia grisea TaxID=148305 RepID=A0A6P8BAC0_PYRGI|nr:uncharacterized protein PgNI_04296 [Pyricularia grisea]TLD12763.1 hypothetical protein PgNI_04296 [Pyricularia grisea]